MKLGLLSKVFVSAVAVGAGHYGLSGFDNGIASTYVGLSAAWGAIAMDIVSSAVSSRELEEAPTPQNPE